MANEKIYVGETGAKELYRKVKALIPTNVPGDGIDITDGEISVKKDSSLAFDASGNLEIADAGVSSDKIADGAVTSSKLASDAIPVATDQNDGLMSAEDKAALDGVSATYATKTELEEAISGVESEIPTYTPGDGISIVSDEISVKKDSTLAIDNSGQLGIADSGVSSSKIADGAVTASKLASDAIPVATDQNDGLMSAEDKAILDGIPSTYATSSELETAVSTIDDTIDTLATKTALEEAISGVESEIHTYTPGDGISIASDEISVKKDASLAFDNSGNLGIADDGVTTEKIADGAVTEEKLESVKSLEVDNSTLQMTETLNAFTLSVKDGGIGASKLASGVVNNAKLKVKLGSADVAETGFTANSSSDATLEIPNATTTTDGLMSASDKSALDGVSATYATKSELSSGLATKQGTLPEGTDGQVLVYTTQGIAWGDAADNIGTGDITTDKLDTKAVTTSKIDDGAVTSTQIASDAVTTSKIADNNVTTSKINDKAVTTAKIDDGSVTATQIAADAVTTAKIADSNVTTEKLDAKAVTTAKIDDGAVTATQIAANAVTTANIADANVTTDKLDTKAVTTAKIADSAVTATQLATDSVTTAKVADGAVTTAKIGASSVTTAKIADSNVTEVKLASNSVTTAKIANSAVTTDKVAAAAVTTAKLANNSVTTPKIANLNVTTGKLADEAVTTEKLADGSVTEDKLQLTKDLTVDNTSMTMVESLTAFTLGVKDGGISSQKLADESVTSSKIAVDALFGNSWANPPSGVTDYLTLGHACAVLNNGNPLQHVTLPSSMTNPIRLTNIDNDGNIIGYQQGSIVAITSVAAGPINVTVQRSSDGGTTWPDVTIGTVTDAGVYLFMCIDPGVNGDHSNWLPFKV